MAKGNKKTKAKNQTEKPLLLHRIATVLGWIVIWSFIISLTIALLALGLWLFSLPDWKQFFERLDAQVLLGYVQALAWPIVSLIVLAVFRKDISALIGRMVKANIPGGSLEFDPSQKPPEEGDLTEIAEVNDAVQVPQSPAITEDEAFNNPEIQVIFERVYRNIFGTQFLALNFLAAYPTALSSSLLQQFFDRHINLMADPSKTYQTLHEYMHYLVNFGLAEFNQAADTYRILPAGALFLRYMASQGLTSDGRNL